MRRQQGMTLVELIVAIVVIGICVVSVLGLLSSLSVRSAAAMTRTQASAVAASYLEDITTKPYAAIGAYDGTNHVGARDTTGALIAGLEQYRVQVNVVADTLGAAPNTTSAQRVEVTVTDPTGATTRLTGYRTSYVGQVLF